MRLRTPLLIVAAMLLLILGGCGDSTSKTTTTDDGVAADLQHVDGALSMGDDGTVTVTPKSGDAVVMKLGPELELAQLQALATTKQDVRAYYREGADKVALVVQKAATAPKNAKEATGEVDAATETTLTLVVDGAKEPLRLSIKPENADQFDVDHLKQHKAKGEPITVYWKSENGTAYALAYKDA